MRNKGNNDEKGLQQDSSIIYYVRIYLQENSETTGTKIKKNKNNG